MFLLHTVYAVALVKEGIAVSLFSDWNHQRATGDSDVVGCRVEVTWRELAWRWSHTDMECSIPIDEPAGSDELTIATS